MQAIAQDLLSRGWNVLPAWPKSKKPALQSWERFQTDRVKEEGLLSWLSRNTQANLIIVTGKISGLAVIDIDSKDWAAVMEKLNLPMTTIVRSAHGIHLYYKHPGVHVKTCRGIIPGVDIRGDGGYVIAPGSTHETGALYEMLTDVKDMPMFPANILEMLKDDAPKGDWVEASNEQASWVTQLLENGTPKGSRHDSLVRLCCYLFGKSMPSDIVRSILDGWNRKNSPPIDDYSLTKTIDDIQERFQRGEYAPKAREREEGSVLTSSGSSEEVEAWTSEAGIDAYLSGLESGGSDGAIEIPFGYKLLDESTLGHHRGGVSVVAGYTNVGKTSLVLNTVAGLLEASMRVLILSTEHSVPEVLDRIHALKSGVALQKFTKKQFTHEEITEVRRHSKTIGGLTVCDAFSPDVRLIARAIEKYRPDVVVFDHAQQAATSSDNRYNELSAFARGFKGLMLKYKTAGILVSQLNDLPTGQMEPELKQVSESRVINQIADHVLLLWSASNTVEGDWVNVFVKIAKVKTGGKRARLEYRFNIANNRFIEVGLANSMGEI